MNKKLFVIDDDVHTLKLYENIFEKENYRIITDKGTPDVLQKIIKNKPDLILLDLLMPDDNGFHILKRIKETRQTNHIPVVIITSHQNHHSKIELLKEGIIDYINKPFHKEELVLKVKNYIYFCSNESISEDDNLKLIYHQLKEIFISKNLEWIEPEIDKMSPLGYAYPSLSMVKDFTNKGEDRKMLEEWAEKDLVERSLVDVIELCPVCSHYHVSLNNRCPECNSLNISKVVNDSKELQFVSTFSENTNQCKDCGKRFDSPKILYHCFNCNEIIEPDALLREKIFKYKIQNIQIKNSKEEKNVTIHTIDNFEEQVSFTSKISPDNITFSKKDLQVSFVLDSLKLSKVPFVENSEFIKKLNHSISKTNPKKGNITVMSIETENVNACIHKNSTSQLKNSFVKIIRVVSGHLRAQDIISCSEDQAKLLIMLPNTHLNIAKIIGEKIQDKLDHLNFEPNVALNFASYPQDGTNAEEILSMMEVGIERIVSDMFI